MERREFVTPGMIPDRAGIRGQAPLTPNSQFESRFIEIMNSGPVVPDPEFVFSLTAGVSTLMLWRVFRTIRERNTETRMTSRKTIRSATCLGLLAFGAALFATTSLAQSGDKYKARLAPAPPLQLRGGQAAVAGLGSAAATLSGRRLTITGTFEKMASEATTAMVGLGLVKGARGDKIFDLTVSKAAQADPPGTSGTISGTFDLTPAQVDALRAGKLYIQINSTGTNNNQGAPNGHLLGWILK
jgi:hypothetical protein